MKRVTSSVKRFNSRYRGEVYVDGLKVEQAFFDSKEDAMIWCIEQEMILRGVVRE